MALQRLNISRNGLKVFSQSSIGAAYKIFLSALSIYEFLGGDGLVIIPVVTKGATDGLTKIPGSSLESKIRMDCRFRV